jgi:SAM-dependent methyltransferase
MQSECDLTKDDRIYDEYGKQFRNKDYAREYHQLFNPRSIGEFINRKNFLGWLVGKFENMAVKRLLPLCNGDLVLDVPCGSGKLMPSLIKNDFSIIGIDLSKDMLSSICDEKLKKLTVIQADIRKLPLKDNSIGVIICNRFLHRIPPEIHLNALQEIYRVSKEYVILYFSIRGVLTNCIISLEKILNIGDRGKIFYMSKKTIKEELDSIGWDFIKGTAVIPMVSTGYIVIAKKK